MSDTNTNPTPATQEAAEAVSETISAQLARSWVALGVTSAITYYTLAAENIGKDLECRKLSPWAACGAYEALTRDLLAITRELAAKVGQ